MTSKTLAICMLLSFGSMHMSAQYINNRDGVLIAHNIVSYHIRNAVDADASEIISPGRTPIFQLLMPLDGKFEIEVKPYKGKEEYPIEEYQLFSLYLADLAHLQKSEMVKSRKLLGFSFDENYLIAYNSKDSTIKYISGNFFKSSIAEDFNLNNSDPSSFYKYLMLRCYNLLPDAISLNKKDNSGMYFTIHSTIANSNFEAFVGYDDHEVVKVLQKDGTHTY